MLLFAKWTHNETSWNGSTHVCDSTQQCRGDDQKADGSEDMNLLRPTRSEEDVRPLWTLPLIFISFSGKPVEFHKHTNMDVKTKPPDAVVMPRIDDEKEAPRIDETDETGQQESNLMKINDRGENQETQIN